MTCAHCQLGRHSPSEVRQCLMPARTAVSALWGFPVGLEAFDLRQQRYEVAPGS